MVDGKIAFEVTVDSVDGGNPCDCSVLSVLTALLTEMEDRSIDSWSDSLRLRRRIRYLKCLAIESDVVN
jgi:hypothetical protein